MLTPRIRALPWGALLAVLILSAFWYPPAAFGAGPEPPVDGGSSAGSLELSHRLSGAVEAVAAKLGDAVTSLANTASTGAWPSVASAGNSPATLGVPGPPETGLPVAGIGGASGRFTWPVDSRRISTLFDPAHQAIDIDEYPAGGNPVRAIAGGIVSFAGGQACCSYGLYVIIQHADGYSSLYAHFSSLAVSHGRAVVQGQELGRSGCTGSCTGDHLHFAIYLHGAPLDPLLVLPSGAEIE